jgi:hypothetical protein
MFMVIETAVLSQGIRRLRVSASVAQCDSQLKATAMPRLISSGFAGVFRVWIVFQAAGADTVSVIATYWPDILSSRV